jgi:hypothetical protein
MAGYREPGFQDRLAAAAIAKNSALEKLKSRPPVDDAVRALQSARHERREAAASEKRAATRLSKEAELAAKAERAAEAASAQTATRVTTEAERKAQRDARYAARKSRRS